MKTRNWKRVISIAMALCVLATGLLMGTVQPVEAAVKNYVLEEGKTYTIQLDGTGAEEKIKFQVESEQITDETDQDGDPVYLNELTVYVNSKAAYQVQDKFSTDKAVGQVYITSIDKNEKIRDIFIALSADNYATRYNVLDYVRYANGKITKKQDLKKYLDATLPKAISGVSEKYKDTYIYYHAMYQIDGSIYTEGNKELMICIDLPDAYAGRWGEFHADYALKLKNGKLIKRDKSPLGSVHNYYRASESASADKKSVFYTSPGGTKKAFTVKKGKYVYVEEYKYVKGVLYLKCTNEDTWKTGWIRSSNFYGFTGNHMQ